LILENVKMKKEWQNVISELVGEQPTQIDSALVSAQSRKRLYWANFPITQPEDKGILLKDIIENGIVDRNKSYCIDANYYKGGNPKSYFEDSRQQLVFKHQSSRRAMVRVGTATNLNGHDYLKRIYSINGKSPTITAKSGGNLEPKIAVDDLRYRKLTPLECERLQTLPDGYTEGVSNTQRYKAIGNGWTTNVIVHILNDLKYYHISKILNKF